MTSQQAEAARRNDAISKRMATYRKILANMKPTREMHVQIPPPPASFFNLLCSGALEDVLLQMSRHPARAQWAAYLEDDHLQRLVLVDALLPVAAGLLRTAAASHVRLRFDDVARLLDVAELLHEVHLTAANVVQLYMAAALGDFAMMATSLRALSFVGTNAPAEACEAVLAAVGGRLHFFQVAQWGAAWPSAVAAHCTALRELVVVTGWDAAVGDAAFWAHVGLTLRRLKLTFALDYATRDDVAEQRNQLRLIAEHCHQLTHIQVQAEDACAPDVAQTLAAYGAQLQSATMKPSVAEATLVANACPNARLSLTADVIDAADTVRCFADRVDSLALTCTKTRLRRRIAVAETRLAGALCFCGTLRRFVGTIDLLAALLEAPKQQLAELVVRGEGEGGGEHQPQLRGNIEEIVAHIAEGTGGLRLLAMTAVAVSPVTLRRLIRANSGLRELRLQVGCRGAGSAMDYRGVDFSNMHDRHRYFDALFRAFRDDAPALEVALIETMAPQRVLAADSTSQCDRAVADAAVQLGHRKIMLEVDGHTVLPRRAD